MMLILIIILIALYAASVFFGLRSKRTAVRLCCWLLTILFSALPMLFVVLILSMSSYPVANVTFGLIAYALLELFLLALMFRKIRRRAVWIPLLCAVCALALAFGAHAIVQSHRNSFAVFTEPDLLWLYNPLNDNAELARLQEPSTLSLTDNLPSLDGATALYPVYSAFANAVYPAEVLNPGLNGDDIWEIDPEDFLACTTTSGAYRALVDGDADVIFAAAPSEAQLQYAADNGEELVLTPIGRECFVFFVNDKSPVTSLTMDQLRGIYSGEITRWNTLGGSGAIRAFQREEGSGSQTTMKRFMGDTPLMAPKMEDVADGMGGVIRQTADYRNYPGAIGYSFRFYCTDMVQNGEIRLLEIDGVAPTKENIVNGAYPICDVFYAVTLASNDNPSVPLLLDWMLSEQGQSLIDQTGYVPLA